MILLLRSTDITTDSRVQKYINFYKSGSISYLCIGWDRKSAFQDQTDVLYYRRKAQYGSGIRNVFNIASWNVFLLQNLLKLKKEYNIIHACDFDTILPALFLKIFFRKKVIFDIFDLYTDSRYIKNKLLLNTIKFLENWAVKNSDNVIVCEEERKEQLYYLPDNVHTLSNIPNINYIPVKKVPDPNIFKISYVGILSSGRNIQNLLSAISKRPRYFLLLAGFGELEDLCKQYASLHNNIIFHGSVPYDKALRIMDDSDIIFACYDRINRNHIFAAPNKYYEALFLGKPLITTEGTLIGRRTEKYKTGFLVTEEASSLEYLLDNEVNVGRLLEKSLNCEYLWEQCKKRLNDSFDAYSKMIRFD